MNSAKRKVEDRFANSVKGRVFLSSGCNRRTWCGCKAAIKIGKVAILSFEQNTREEHSDAFHSPKVNLWRTVSEEYFNDSIKDYHRYSIDEVLTSSNPIVRGLGLLDARLGIRRLSRINVRHEPEFIRKLFLLRCEVEGLAISEHSHTVIARTPPKYVRTSASPADETTATSVLARKKRNEDPKTILRDLRNGSTIENNEDTLKKAIMEAFNASKDRQQFENDLMLLAKSSKLVNATYIHGLLETLSDRNSWLRPLANWKSRSHNAGRQFGSLLRYLFAKYDVPFFMDCAWMTGDRLHQNWYKHIATGQNIRTAKALPVTLTRMMAHHFLSAPESYTVNGALRWGQLMALGCDKRTIDAVVTTRIYDDYRDEDFWLSVFRFLAQNPMLDPQCIGPIIDYIWNQRYVPVVVFIERGVAENRGPVQPNFSMKGRSVQSIMQQVERWHNRLGRRKPNVNLEWEKSEIPDFEFVEGRAESKNMRVWRIRELLSSKELVEEGRQLRHCVASYAHSCQRQERSIWSMTVQTELGNYHVVTIEMHSKSKVIGQVRGRMNRYATDHERRIIQRWTTKEGLNF